MNRPNYYKNSQMSRILLLMLSVLTAIPIHAQDIGKTLPDTIMQQDSVESNLLRSQEMNFTDPPTFSENVIYPSPSSSVFKKYTGSQPSLSTGTVNIPISLYELKYRDITIPFTLRYSTSGIKVFDESYPTGLGWTLTPGLRLTRQIMNRPDEKFRRISYTANTTLVYDSLFLSSLLIDNNHSQYEGVDYVDSQHDIFTLHLINNSYNFLMHKNADGTFAAVDDGLSGLKIDTDSSFSHFTVTDNSGIRYRFGGVTEADKETGYITAWMLDSIILVNGDVLSFTWNKSYHSCPKEFVPSVLYDSINGRPNTEYYTYVDASQMYEPHQPIYSINSHAHLTGVQFPTGNIIFSYKTGDSGDRYPILETMLVKNSENAEIKRIEFTYDSVNTIRQFLETVWISDEGTYSFDYNKVDIPYLSRYAQDWWGYYNGITQNSSRVPKVNIRKYLLNANGEMWEYGESDRDVNADHMQANILTRVHYPLGGTATFEYEPHTWRISQMKGKMMTNLCQDSIFGPTVTGGGLRVKRMTVQASADAAPVITEYKYGIGEDGMAECVAMPLPHSFINSRHAYNHTFAENDDEITQFYLYTYRETQINPESQYMKWHINETPIWYKEVTEYKGGGKTVYKFDRKCYANSISTSWGGGHPYQIRTLSSKGIVNTAVEQYSHENGSWHKLHSRSYHYLLNQGPQLLTDFEVQRLAATNVPEQPFSPDIQCGVKTVQGKTQTYLVPFAENECYAAHNYRIEFYTELLSNVCDTLFTPSGNRVAEEIYEYALNTELITSKTTTVNGNTVKTESFSYPFQTGLQLAAGQQQYLDSLVGANRISTPVITSVTRNGYRSEAITEYGLLGGRVRPASEIYRRNGSQRTLAAYQYDTRGNILEISHNNGFRIESFLWGYGRELPVAAIAGYNYAHIEQALGSVINQMALFHAPAPESIRSSLTGALLQTYGYKPLVGLSENRDFKGAKTSFIYDNAYRLEKVKDGDGSIVESYAYKTYSDSISIPAHGMTPDVGGTNYIRQCAMLDASGNSHIDKMQFFDGIGREETALIRDFWQSGALATLQTYDSLGHADRKWLPVPVTGNDYITPSQIMAQGISSYNDTRPYSKSVYLPFPADSVIAVYGPGTQWEQKGVTAASFVNTASSGRLACARFSVGADGSLVNHGSMPAGMLLVAESADEDGHATLTFTDLEGRTLLTRAMLGDTFADTYSVYDGYGQLRYVLPPEASRVLAAQNGQWSLSNETIDKYCYAYRYNDYGECIEKKLPGCASVLMHYDNGGRLVLEQDGNQRENGLWHISLYDKFGRLAVSSKGSLTDPAQWAAAAEHATFTGSGSLAGYAFDGNIPASNDILQVNYYDSYDFLSIFTAHSDSLSYRMMNGYDNKYQGAGDAVAARGMLTGTASRVLNTSGNGGLLVRSMYYDLHGNLVQSHEQNHLGGYEHYYYHLTFTGKPLKVMHVHTTPDTTNTDIYEYTYDNMERLLTTTVRHDGASAVTLCQNTYNSLGQLATHSLGSSSQGTISYTYNVRGWPTAITSAPFKQWLHYQDTYGTATPCWNGNVSAMEWESLDALLATQPARHSYAYTYDGLNRLTAAAHEAVDYDNWSGSLVLMNEPDYSCTYSYDLNGNITSLTRKGVLRTVKLTSTVWVSGEIDHLSMTYDGNRLRKVSDQCAELTYAGAMDFKDGIDKQEEYLWDANGNMTRDRNKGIYNITYNVLNLPECIEYYDGHEVRYTYAADGRKLHVDYVLNPYAIADDDGGGELPAPDPEGPEGLAGMAGTLTGGDGLQSFDGDPIEIEEPGEELLPQVLMTRDWCGDHIYKNGTIERIENEYGYWADSCYHYRIADYQGNVRAVISQNGVLEEVNGYYPYGGLLGAPATGVQPNKYGGKELDRENGLDWLDFEARMYDPMLPQYNSMDRKAEDYSSSSPFAYCAGNPIRYIDPTGEEKLIFFDKKQDPFLYLWAVLYKDDGAIHVFAHGNNKKISITTVESKRIISNPEEFKTHVLNKSKTWVDAKKNNKNITIILHSCNTANGDDSFAEELSKDKELKDDRIIAPTKEIGVESDFDTEVRSLIYDNKGNAIKCVEGCWSVFKNGKRVQSFDSTWKAKEKPTLWDRIAH